MNPEELVYVLLLAGLVSGIVWWILHRKRSKEATNRVESDYEHMKNDAEKAALQPKGTYSCERLMSEVMMAKAEAYRAYGHNRERFGEAVSFTVYLTAIVLFVTGLAQGLKEATWTDAIMMVVGLLIAVCYKAYNGYQVHRSQ